MGLPGGIGRGELALLLGAMAAAGALTGLLAGMFGVGGGAVVVPVLYELFTLLDVPLDVRMPLCVGTSLAVIIPTSIRSVLSHHKRGAVNMDILRVWAVPVVLGVIASSVIARHAPQSVFKIVFVVLSGLIAIRLLSGKDSWRIASELPSNLVMRVVGFCIGALSTLMGTGGGAMGTMVMTLYARPIHQAVATSAGLGVFISIPAAIGYIYAGWPKAAQFADVAALQWPLALGYVSLIGFILMTPTSILATPLGAYIAHALPRRQLEIAFGVLQLLVCARFIYSLASGT